MNIIFFFFNHILFLLKFLITFPIFNFLLNLLIKKNNYKINNKNKLESRIIKK